MLDPKIALLLLPTEPRAALHGHVAPLAQAADEHAVGHGVGVAAAVGPAFNGVDGCGGWERWAVGC